ncbi:MAG: TetR/AcrR family transcriptional regulator [Acidimicrobiales bacterium]
MGDTPEEPSASLAEDQQQLTRSRIRRAAMKVVARRGFAATVDEIAKVSGVSPRTIFRHYSNHDLLIATTVKDMYEACGRRPIEGLAQPTDDLDGWIEGLAITIHTRNAEIVGDAFWDIHAPRLNASAALSELDAFRRQYRTRGVRHLVAVAWRTAGGRGDPPEDLAMAFALNFSAFTTQALMVDFDQTPAQIGMLTAAILKVLLRRAIDAQPLAPSDAVANSAEH